MKNFRSVLITGAGQGLGRALALELARPGVTLGLMARTEIDLVKVKTEVAAKGARAVVLVCDLAEKTAIHSALGKLCAISEAPVDLLINNASTLGPRVLEPLLDTACEDFERALTVNVLGAFRLTKAVLSSMALHGEGCVVNISSDAAVELYPNWGAYGASKAAWDHLLRIWAVELEGMLPAGRRPKILLVDPGEMNTRLHRQAVPEADPLTLSDPSEVAHEISRIILNHADLKNGQRIAIRPMLAMTAIAATRAGSPR